MSMIILLQRRNVATKAPGSNPLEILRKESYARKLCDEQGFRFNDTHWVCAVSLAMVRFSHTPKKNKNQTIHSKPPNSLVCTQTHTHTP